MTKDEARKIAAGIAELPKLLKEEERRSHLLHLRGYGVVRGYDPSDAPMTLLFSRLLVQRSLAYPS
jgi:hypothetical protein